MSSDNKREKITYKSELAFVTNIANHCLAKMKKKDREYLINNPYTSDYHFSYCLYIRNHYIQNRDFSDVDFFTEPDYLSSQILKMIFSMLIPGYIYGDPFTESIFDNRQYIELRKTYYKIYGQYPDYLLDTYRSQIDFEPEHSFSVWSDNKGIDLDEELEIVHHNEEKSDAAIEKVLADLSGLIGTKE